MALGQTVGRLVMTPKSLKSRKQAKNRPPMTPNLRLMTMMETATVMETATAIAMETETATATAMETEIATVTRTVTQATIQTIL